MLRFNLQRTMCVGWFVAAALSVSLLTPVASAGMIEVLNGTTPVFQDNGFEGVSTPTAITGSWASYTSVSGSLVAIISTSPPGAADGTNYLDVHRGGSGSHAEIAGNFTSAVTSGQTLHASFNAMFYGNSVVPLLTGGIDALKGDWTIPTVSPFGVGYTPSVSTTNLTYYKTGVGSGWIDTGLAVTTAAWQSVQVDYTVGATSFDLTVDGTKKTLTLNSFTGSIDTLGFRANASNTGMYVDAVVPEPSTLARLAAGLVGLLCYAWRKRK